jgi:hypothetical protein
MKSINLILLATAVLAIASLVVGPTAIAQAKNIFNQHAHSNLGKSSNDGSVTNCSGSLCFGSTGSPVDKFHSNTNDNTNRPVGEDGVRSHTNAHEIPNKK